MAKQVASFRLDEKVLTGLDRFAEFLDVPRTTIVEQALIAAMTIHPLGSQARSAIWDEILRRYGADAEFSIRAREVDGDPDVSILVDGKKPEDLIIHYSIGNEKAYTFLEVKDWYPDVGHGTVGLGDEVLLTHPLLAVGDLPWPPTKPLALGFRLGDLLEATGQTASSADTPSLERVVKA